MAVKEMSARLRPAVARLLAAGVAMLGVCSLGATQALISDEYIAALKAECSTLTQGSGAAEMRACLQRLTKDAGAPGDLLDLSSVPRNRRNAAIATCAGKVREGLRTLDSCVRAALGQQQPAAASSAPPAPSAATREAAPAAGSAAITTRPAVAAETFSCDKTEPIEAAPRAAPAATERRSVSLGVLQAMLAKCGPAGNCAPEVLHLGGLIEVEGVVLDPARDDLVIWGQAARFPQAAAGIPTEDLAFALRSAWGRYDRIAGRSRTIIPPVLSLDPDPAAIADQAKVLERVLPLARSDFEASGQAWIRACSRPQTVRLEGVPPGSHPAEVMLKADYDLKSIANGTLELAAWGVESISTAEQRKFRDDVCRQKPSPQAEMRMDRFWFHGGLLEYGTAEGAIELGRVEVKLSTEAQMLARSGKLTGQGRSSPEAERFVTAFRDRMREVGQVLPVYRDLMDLFRVVALAIAVHDGLGRAAETRLAYLLDGLELLPREFPKRRDGLGRFTSTSVQIGDSTHRMFGASCGGVEAWFHPSSRQRLADPSGKLLKTARRALAQRRPGALWWTVTEN